MNETIKKILIKYGYFCLIIFSLFLLLTLTTVLSRKSWTLGLKAQIQSALDTALTEESLLVGDAIQIEQPLSVSAAAYKISKEDVPDEYGCAILIRITALTGPEVGLYLRRPGNSEFKYIGILGDEEFYDVSFPWYKVAYRQIEYWKDRIPLILGEAE